MARAKGGSIRGPLRWGLLAAAAVICGFLLPATIRDFESWRSARSANSSDADLYWWDFIIGVGRIAILVFVTAGIFFLLKPRAAKRDHPYKLDDSGEQAD